jgi:hypothetical protein
MNQGNDLGERLVHLVNGTFAGMTKTVLATVAPYRVFQLEASRFARDYANWSACSKGSHASVNVEVKPYHGKNRIVGKMQRFLAEHVADCLIGAIAHGSIGTCEEVEYSDFDGMVIIRDEVLGDPNRLAHTAYWLNRSRSIMLELDPLQHHGWFVIPEKALDDYANDYFPVEGLEKAACLYCPEPTLCLHLHMAAGSDRYRERFEALASGTRDELRTRRFLRNMYCLKSTLSKLMLLPALYVQARDGRGTAKKHSFALARKDFSPQTWKVLDTISDIRLRWQYRPRFGTKSLVRRTDAIGRIAAKRLASPIPRDILQYVHGDFGDAALRLIREMREKLQRYDGPPSPSDRHDSPETDGLGGPSYETDGLGGPSYETDGLGGPSYEIDGLGGPSYETDGLGGPSYEIDGLGGPSYRF